MGFSNEKFSKRLIEKNLVTESQLKSVLDLHKQSGEKVENILLQKKLITDDDLLSILGELYNIPSVKLDSYLIDKSIINTIPLSMARKYHVIPIIKMEDELAVAMADPLNVFAIDAIEYHTGCKLQISIASPSDIEQAINKYYSLTDSMDELVKDMDQSDMISIEGTEKINISEESNEASVIRLVNLVLLQAIRDRASDIHFEPDETIFRIRYRVDGLLQEAFMPPKNMQPMITSRLKILADMDVSERRIPQDGRFSLQIDGKEVDIRASILPTVKGEKAVLRILDKAASILKLNEMGFSDYVYERWVPALKNTEGILLITGPTGSGKTTTLYAVLNEINSKEKNIITVENPVEYKFPYINQVEVNPKAGLTFASGLRSILRQDPDIIMIGEIRDRETAEIAIRSALTGHLVFSTLHTNDAPSVIARLIDMGLEPFLVESSLIAILAQRLVRRICPRCKEEIEFDKDLITRVSPGNNIKIEKAYKGKGCSDCNYSGYQKRTSIHELLLVDDSIRKLIIKGAPTDEIRKTAQKNGMKTLAEDGLYKAAQGITSIDEVMRVAYT